MIVARKNGNLTMRLSLTSLVCLVLIAISFPLNANDVLGKTTQNNLIGFVDGGADGGTATMSPMKRLARSVKMARAGDVEGAFDFAREAATMYSPDKLFSVKYIDTLVRIAKVADDETVSQVLNEAIKKVNSLKAVDSYAGIGDAETGYHFMVSVGKLARELEQRHPKVGAKLKIYQGSVARNLKGNAMYPQNALFSLTGALINEAQGHAAEKNLPKALDAISLASELGFYDFEKLSADKWLSELEDQAALKQHIEQINATYLAKMEAWSREEIAKFQPFKFEFKVDDIAGGNFSRDDFNDKILVVDFWATWCQPCCEGIPHFVKLQRQKHKQGVQVIGISLDSPEDPTSSLETVRDFIENKKVSYPCGLGNEQLKQTIPGDVKLPTTLFIDRDGNVRYMATGFHDYAKIEALTERLIEQGHSVSTTSTQ
jgi:thiol-disulfide isomerase/thioredoxin